MYDDKDYGNHFNKVLWLGTLMVVVFIGVYALIGLSFQLVVPNSLISHWKDKDGIERDSRWELAFWVAFPVTYFLIQGFNKWRKSKNN